MFFYQNSSSAAVQSSTLQDTKPEGYPLAILGGGCFWCVEYEFRALEGVLYTEVGYAGGESENPDYQDITSGETGHAEVVAITYDPEIITYEELIDHFLRNAHDPTQLNRQGVDVGTQYRSVIFTNTQEQEEVANAVIKKINAEEIYSKPVVTEVTPAAPFWEGEDYHQQFYEKYEARTGQKHIRVLLKEKKKAFNLQ